MSLTVIIKKPDEPDFYKDTQWERKPHGTITLDNKVVANSMQCPHCGGHFISRRGSGKRRSWCSKCAAVTCGRKECVETCRHWRAKIEDFERAEQRRREF